MCHWGLDLIYALGKYITTPHQLQRQHPAPKPPASLSTVIKAHPQTQHIFPQPRFTQLFTLCMEEGGEEGEKRGGEAEKWRGGAQ